MALSDYKRLPALMCVIPLVLHIDLPFIVWYLRNVSRWQDFVMLRNKDYDDDRTVFRLSMFNSEID